MSAVRTVWKFPLVLPAFGAAHAETVLPALFDAEILVVGADPSGVPCVWVDHVLADPADQVAPDDPITIVLHGTGSTVGLCDSHVASLVVGPYVWHAYIKGKP